MDLFAAAHADGERLHVQSLAPHPAFPLSFYQRKPTGLNARLLRRIDMKRTLELTLLLGSIFLGLLHGQTFQVIHSFTGGTDGANPFAGLTMDSAGNLYGVTSAGGGGSCVLVSQPGCGLAYKLTSSNGTWDFSPLYGFQGQPDGAAPLAQLTIGANGKLYGTTAAGGEGPCSYLGDPDCGTVFEIPETRGRIDKILYRFSGGSDGGDPLISSTVFLANNIYGTTNVGGDLSCNNPYGCGVVYQLTPTGKETVLHQFTDAGGDGAFPIGSMVADKSGHLYGTTAYGGNLSTCSGSGCGTIFELLHSASGWTERILYSFTGTADGENPNGGLIIDTKGNLYGTTYQGGAGGGSVFELHRNASGNWSLYVLTSFENAGFTISPLVMDSNGNIYGTTQNGGGDGSFGRVFELIPNGKNWSYKELYDFTGMTDGGNPLGGLVLDSAGNLYGTTVYYGSPSCGGSGCGVIFEVTP
jgi:uncharacterized repeat protein (TIGR03803 family)